MWLWSANSCLCIILVVVNFLEFTLSELLESGLLLSYHVFLPDIISKISTQHLSNSSGNISDQIKMRLLPSSVYKHIVSCYLFIKRK